MRKLKMKLPMSSAMYCYLINRYLTALPDTRSWQVPKAYRVLTPEPTV